MILAYSDEYDLNLGAHVFPSVKYKLIKQKLLGEGVVKPEEIVSPEPATDEDVALVHDRDYIWKLKNGELSYTEILRMEVPYSPELVRAVWLSAGGSILAGREAIEDGASANIGGGFHHAFPDHGEGFCVLHDVAIAIRRLQIDKRIERAMTVDLDVHQGNGTAAIFADDERVFTFSMHQQNNYPVVKPPSSRDINLPDGVRDQEYLDLLRESLDEIIPKFKPQIIFFIAGADPYWDDQLGGLRLSLEGLAMRDRMVFEKARAHGVPVAVTLAGGYARNIEDTVHIHANTLRITKEFGR